MSVALFIQVICVGEGSDFLLCRVIWELAQLSGIEQSHGIVKAWQRKESARLKKKKEWRMLLPLIFSPCTISKDSM